MNDIEHPAIRETERTGYHDPAYLEWEWQQEREVEEDDRKFWRSFEREEKK